MQSVAAVMTFKRIANARLRRSEDGQDLLSRPGDLLRFDDAFEIDYLIERISGLGVVPAINCLHRALAPEQRLGQLRAAVGERDERIVRLDGELAAARRELAAMRETLSWRITSPLRRLKGSAPRFASGRQCP